MKIAIKFNSQGDYQSHCTDSTIVDLKQIVPNSAGFEFYDITEVQLADMHYLKLVNNAVTIDEAAKQTDISKAAKAQEMSLKRARLTALSQDLLQSMAGEIVPNFERRKEEFITLHNEIRAYEGKAAREVIRIL